MKLALVAAAACGSSPPRALGDFSAVQPTFAPTTATISELAGISYQLPAEANATRAFALSALQQAGVHHARADLTWSIVEPSRGALDFSWYHSKVDGYSSAGVETLPILCYGNPWANATPRTSDHYPPDDPHDFAAFAGAAAAEFALPVYEVWNEENLGFTFWQPREQPDAYGTLLADAATKIRAADPAALVMLGGLFDLDEINLDAETFLQLAYRAHPALGKSYDILAVHPYPTYPPHVAPELDDDANGEVAEARMIARLRAVLAYWGDDPARPIWVTELGWPTYGAVDEERQARWLVRSALLLAGAGVERVFWYTLFDGPNPTAYPPEDAFGLFHNDDPPTPKLAWTALSTLLSLAGPLAVTADVSDQLAGAPPDARAYQLTGARTITVVWRSDDDAAPTMVTVPVTGAVQVVDMLGTQLPASPTVPLSGRPVYVIEN
jgi:hypothetical protein